jgi:hypothetical protein
MDAANVNVNRRQLLLTTSAVGSLALIAAYSQPTRVHASPAKYEPITAKLFYTTGSVFLADFTSQLPYSVLLGAIVDGGSSDLAGATLTVNFDERGQAWSGEDARLQGKLTTPLRTSRSSVGSVGVLEIELPKAPGLGNATVVFPLRPTRLYPAENVGPLGDTTLELSGSRIETFAMTAVPDQSVSIGTAWGVELLASWARTNDVKTFGGDSYAYPREIAVSSVGPAPIPAGAAVQIVVDAGIVSSINASVMSLTVEGTAAPLWHFEPLPDSAQTGGSIVLDGPLAAGTTLLIAVDSQLASTSVVTDSITYGRVSLTSPESAAPMRRSSLMETTTAVSSSGTPLVTNGARGKN